MDDSDFIYGNYIYTRAIRELLAFNHSQILECFKEIEKEKSGYFVGYLTYECGIILQGYAYRTHGLFTLAKTLETKWLESLESLESNLDSKLLSSPHKPLLYFKLFKKRKRLKLDSIVSHELLNDRGLKILESLDTQKYTKDFKNIKEAISRGDTYQINLTQEIKFHSSKQTQDLRHIESKSLFLSLCKNQNTKSKAFITNNYEEILCFSPELFFKLRGYKITLEPMKGTARRGQKRFLENDAKNRSENVMIVDLLRNDLSKIIKKNSLKVQKICHIKTYKTLHQMVSRLEARIKRRLSLLDIFIALFPSGSITGAPKLESMKIINELEQRSRNVYCGAIGVISCEPRCKTSKNLQKNSIKTPPKRATFSIPIRTLYRNTGEDFYRYGVGSGIVWDSKMQEEIEELELKCRFLRI